VSYLKRKIKNKMTSSDDIPTEYKVILEKEYYKLDPSKPTIGLLMMVKNENKRLHVSLNSVIGHVDALIIFDTGSTDNTIDIIRNFSETHKINLYLIQGEFTNFSISRNTSLHYADSIGVHYLLLLDCNDELRGGKNLKLFVNDYFTKNNNCFLVCQEWFNGLNEKYYNIRLVKNRCGWRYRGSVHEWMKDTNKEGPEPTYPVIRIPDELGIVLYQDRTQDDDKSGKRFTRDRELLLKDHLTNPKDPRTLFYLAQTCECLLKYDEALYYSKLRLEQDGFEEEKFHSYMRCGNSCLQLEHNWEDVMGWYIKAYEHSLRAEAVVKIADYYRHRALTQDSLENHNRMVHNSLQEGKEVKVPYNRKPTNFWRIAYMFAHEACDLSYPDYCILFVDKGMYDYYRWHLMGIIGFYVGKYEEGKAAALKALATKINPEENEKILKFYLDHEEADKKIIPVVETKGQYINKTYDELKQKYPGLPHKQLQNKAVAIWKKRSKK